jgi:hypothetical protein
VKELASDVVPCAIDDMLDAEGSKSLGLLFGRQSMRLMSASRNLIMVLTEIVQ